MKMDEVLVPDIAMEVRDILNEELLNRSECNTESPGPANTSFHDEESLQDIINENDLVRSNNIEDTQQNDSTSSHSSRSQTSTFEEADKNTQEIEQAIPPEIEQTISQELEQAISQEIEQAIPQEIEQAIPQEIEQAIPQEIEQSIPQEVEQAIPQEVEQAIPQEVEQALLQESSENFLNNETSTTQVSTVDPLLDDANSTNEEKFSDATEDVNVDLLQQLQSEARSNVEVHVDLIQQLDSEAQINVETNVDTTLTDDLNYTKDGSVDLPLEPIIELTENDKQLNDEEEQLQEFLNKHENSQIPDELSPEEQQFHVKFFQPSHMKIQCMRIHCTACNEHLGTAPNQRYKRRIHPLLKVTICKKCFDFYGSGDFDKDVDGSELYCRWCGQGGNVLCCASCPYVFCQKCIRTNLGKKYLAKIKELDDWTCFACRPTDIIKHRVVCRALYDYTKQELERGIDLKTDKSLCCLNKPGKYQVKTKIKDEIDAEEAPPKKKTKISSNKVASQSSETWNQQIEDEVVCTPDLSMLMNGGDEDDEQSSNRRNPDSNAEKSTPQQLEENCDKTLDDAVARPLPPLLYTGEGSTLKKVVTNPASKQFMFKTVPVLASVQQKFRPIVPKDGVLVSPNYVQFAKSASIKVGNTYSAVKNGNNITAATTLLAPNLKHEWFDKASLNAAQINGSLSARLCALSKQKTTVTSLQELARVHNNLQEILSSTVNNLMQVRKSLRNDFIVGLKKLKFQQPNDSDANVGDKNDTPVNNGNNSSNDDVIVIEPEDPLSIINSSHSPSVSAPSTDSTAKRPYLKVKPISELSGTAPTIPNLTPLSRAPQTFFKIKPLKQLMPTAKLIKPASMSSIPKIIKPDVSKHLTLVIQSVASLQQSQETPAKKSKLEVFDDTVKENMKYRVSTECDDAEKKKILSVQVVLQKKFGNETLREIPRKNYTPFKNFSENVDDQNGESYIVNDFLPKFKNNTDDDSCAGIPFLKF